MVGSLAKLARDTGAAPVVIHHKGESEELFRGSSAIQNQTDALFGLVRFEDMTRRVRSVICGVPWPGAPSGRATRPTRPMCGC